MNDWIISVAAIIILTVVAGIILPEGKTNKLIKSVFSIVCLFVLIMPIQYLNNNNFSISNLFSISDEFELDETFLYFTSSEKAESIKIECYELLEKEGITGTDIQIIFDTEKIVFTIEKVYVNIKNIVILENYQHININVVISNLLTDNLNIEAEQIIIYE
jgi:autonomous glycyl radical cofactor GrcA